jgi:hypothetical protein
MAFSYNELKNIEIEDGSDIEFDLVLESCRVGRWSRLDFELLLAEATDDVLV